jgi:hypothetical protein
MNETPITEPQYATLKEIADKSGVAESTLKIKLTVATQKGIALPLRKRIGKQFLYDRQAFMNWLWEHADAIRRPMPTITTK